MSSLNGNDRSARIDGGALRGGGRRPRRPFGLRDAGRYNMRPVGTALVILGTVFLAACKQDARLADARLRDPVVKDVTVAGLTLDQNATPEMVTFALLQAIKEDLEAGKDLEARERAFDKQFDLAAPSAIHAQYIRAVASQHAELVEPRESVYKTVRTWAPTLGHYVGSFDFSFEEARPRMRVLNVSASSRRGRGNLEERHVLLEARDPDGDPNASVVVKIRLVREEGRWRVWWVGFERSTRHLPTDQRAGGKVPTPKAG